MPDCEEIENRLHTARVNGARPGRNCSRNLFAVEPSILNKNFARRISANDDPRQIYSRHIAFMRFRIESGLVSLSVEGDA